MARLFGLAPSPDLVRGKSKYPRQAESPWDYKTL